MAELGALLSWNGMFWFSMTAYSLACIGVGGLAGMALRYPRLGKHTLAVSVVPRLALQFVLGLGALGQFWTLLALAGLLIQPVVFPALAVLALAGILVVRADFAALRKELRRMVASVRAEGPAVGLLALTCAGIMVFTVTCLGRPFSGDSLALHMMLAKATASSGRLSLVGYNVGNEYFGALGEMTYAVLMQLCNADAAQMISWVAFLALAAIVVGLGEKCGLGTRGKIFALAAYLSSTAVLFWVGEGKIDLLASSMGLASLMLLVPSVDLRPLPRRTLVIAGILAGCAVSTKLTLGFCIATAGAVLLLWTYAPRSWSLRPQAYWGLAQAVALVAAGGIVGLCPQMVKNGLLIGAPFAPLGTQDTAWLVEARWYDAATVAHIRLLYPLVLTFGAYFAQYGNLSVLVLAWLPLALLLARPKSFRGSPITATTIAAWVAIAGWATFEGDKVIVRYILPTLLMCIPLSAAAAEMATARGFWPRSFGIGIVGSALVALAITIGFSTDAYFIPSMALRIASGMATPCDRGLMWCRPMDLVNLKAPEGARVLSISTHKYYLRPDLIQCSFDHRPPLFPGNSPEERWLWLYDQGYSFILPDWTKNPPELENDLKAPPSWVKVTRYWPKNPMSPIRVTYLRDRGGPVAAPRTSCVNVDGRRWQVQTSAGE